MAKVFKVVMYVSDYNGDIGDSDNLKTHLENYGVADYAGVNIFELKESEEFEFHDDLAINKIAATSEDFEAYFNNPTDDITISRERFEDLLEAEDFLSCLNAAGVDNWSGYSDACQIQAEGEDE